MKKILLFEDFSKRYKRWYAGEVRDEEKLKSNIESMKPIDLGSGFPVLFADINLVIEGSDRFTFHDIEEYIPKIEEYGWRLPKYGEIQKMFYAGNQPPRPKNNVEIEWKSSEYGSINNILSVNINK